MLALAKKYGIASTDDACAMALETGAVEYRFARRYLERNTPAVQLTQSRSADPPRKHRIKLKLQAVAAFGRTTVWFSRYGTLLATVEAFVNRSPNGYYAPELANELHAEVQEPLRHPVQQQRLNRTDIDGQFLYTAIHSP